MQQLKGLLVSIQFGNNEDLSKESHLTARVELDGFVGDKHRGASRVAYSGDREPKGTVLRNDRQWSGVSVEELAEISQKMDLSSMLSPQTLGANICIKGVAGFSLLPRGTRRTTGRGGGHHRGFRGTGHPTFVARNLQSAGNRRFRGNAIV